MLKLFKIFCFTFFLPYFLHAQDYEVIRTLRGHQGGVQNIRFSPDGKLLASCGKNDHTVAIWNVKTGRRMASLTGHQALIYEVTFDRSGKLLASASKDGTVKVWEVTSRKLVGNFENQPVISPNNITYKSVAFVSFSADSKYVFFGGDNGFLCKGKLGTSTVGAFYRSKRMLQVNNIDPHANISITGGAVSADGRSILVSIDHFVHRIDIKSEKIVNTFFYPFAYINDVIVGPGRDKITTWSYDGKITVWNYYNQRMIKSLQVTAPKNYSVASFSTNKQLMTSGAFGNSARVWSWQSGQAIAKLSDHTKIVRISRFSPIEHLIATASYDGFIKLWEPTKENPEVIEEAVVDEKPIITAPSKIVSPLPKDELELYGEKVEKGKLIELEQVHFEQSKYELLAATIEDLKLVAKLMKDNPTMKIEIHGHTDIQGHPIENYKLSQKRAQACMDYLIQIGIAANRLAIKAFGESKPISRNSNEKDQKNNRRVEIKIISL
ncbi:MAG: OmpA family protein [Flammeovirgaceae bacterium]